MNPSPPLDSAAAVRAARERAGLSQSELAARTGTSQASVSDIERNRRRPTVELLDRLLAACHQRLTVVESGREELDPDDVMLLRLNMMRSPAERLAQMGRVARLRGLARR